MLKKKYLAVPFPPFPFTTNARTKRFLPRTHPRCVSQSRLASKRIDRVCELREESKIASLQSAQYCRRAAVVVVVVMALEYRPTCALAVPVTRHKIGYPSNSGTSEYFGSRLPNSRPPYARSDIYNPISGLVEAPRILGSTTHRRMCVCVCDVASSRAR